ncbi:MAG: hypothetical protein MUF81_16040, partial [Verrucomicrobia bacterium]|nr:hypothetical protein [Verrucomicrobiota bacterium]
GYLQWHFRTSDKAVPDDPVISKEHSIRKQDAVLAYDRKEMITWAMARENPDLPGLPDDVRERLKQERGLQPASATDGESTVKRPEGRAPEAAQPSTLRSQPITVWDGRTMKTHAVTGKDVPDDTARVPLWHYVNPRKAEWPEADYIVGNPPFLGASKVRADLGDGYAETLRSAYKELPESCDFVMYWWDKAAHLLRENQIKRFGSITTKAISQTFNRRIVEPHLAAKNPASIIFAIPNHPWVDSADGADVRIAMTVATQGDLLGELNEVIRESADADGGADVQLKLRKGKVLPSLQIGANTSTVSALKSNGGISNTGVKLHGAGFIVSTEDAVLLGLGRVEGIENHIRRYRHGRDIAQTCREAMVIDLDGLPIDEVQRKFPEVFQRIVERVKPERDQNRERYRRENWWLFGRRNTELRAMLRGLPRYISTPETAKHRYFVFLEGDILPDNMLVSIGSEDGFTFGVLSSCTHVSWALSSGGRLGVGDDPRYNKSRCFETFPFPSPDEATRERIRELGEQLDAHRKRQQALHPGLTLTGMYNVLEKLRALDGARHHNRSADCQSAVSPTGSRPGATQGGGAGASKCASGLGGTSGLPTRDTADCQSALRPGVEGVRSATEEPQPHDVDCPGLTAKEKLIHEQGLVSVLKQIHDDLDAAVFHAYGWDDLIPCSGGLRPSHSSNDGGAHRDAATVDVDEIILERLVALNHERAEEEKRGLIRWLRPEFQNPGGVSAASPTLELDDDDDQEAAPSPHTGRRPVPQELQPKQAWPKALSEQVEAVRRALEVAAVAVTAADLAARFQRADKKRIAEILETLLALGKARETDGGRFKGQS